jgi:outer membrane receptor protein involved in Fe transport
MYLVFVQDRGWNPNSTGNAVGDVLTGRITQVANAGSKPPEGEFRMWNSDFFAQDSWKVKPNFTLEVGVRGGYWTNNEELNGLGAYFDKNQFDPTKGEFLDPGTFQVLNGYCYISSGCAPSGILENRGPFAMPRVNVAWDLDG